MHELSLASDILDTVRQNLPEEDYSKLESIVLEVGTFSGVISDSLKFSFEAITSGTKLAHAELEIIDIPFRLKCIDCGGETEPEFPMMYCEKCSGINTKILQGDELKIKELKLTDKD